MSGIEDLLPRNSHVRPYPFEQLFPAVRLLWMEVSLPTRQQSKQPSSKERLTAESHLRSSSLVQVPGSPLGSCSEGNMSPPQIAHTATPVTKPVKAIKCQHRTREVAAVRLPRKVFFMRWLELDTGSRGEARELTLDFRARSSGVGILT